MKSSFRTLIISVPNTVRDIIFSRYLDKSSKLITRQVCRRWKTLVDQTLQFRVLLKEDTFEFVEKFGKRRSINELIVGFFSQSYPLNGWKISVKALSILSDYRYDVFYEDSSSNGSENQPALAMVVMPETKLERLFKEFKNISKLTLSSTAIVDVKRHSFLQDMKFMNLKILNITAEIDHGLDGVRDMLSNNFRKLREFSLKINNTDDDMTLYEDMYLFIGNHKLLKSLTCHHVRVPAVHHCDPRDIETQGIMNLHRDQKLEPVEYATLLNNLGKVQLEHMDLYILSSEGRTRKNLTLHMLHAQKVLTTLHLCNLRPENMPIWRTVPSVLNECSGTLKSIILDGCFCDHLETDPPGSFSGSYVHNCLNLKTLEFMVCGVNITELPKFPKSSITTLFLGHALKSGQIKYILNNFKELEHLSLPQAQVSLTQVGNPQISLTNFRNALKLPKLSKLSLSTKNCKYRQIRKFAANLFGVFENGQETLLVETKRGDVLYEIDREIFVPPMSA